MKFLSLIVLLTIISSTASFSQDKPSREERKLNRQQRKHLKKEMRKLAKKILNDEELSQRFYEIIAEKSSCGDCEQEIKDVIKDSTESGDLKKKANGFTFGICHPEKKKSKLHGVVFSKKAYNCKLSSHGEVYDKKVWRKLYGPGLWWDRQSVVMMCTGPAYSKKMTGSTIAVGAYMGITATTLVGKIGICLVVGAGKSAGFFMGGDQYQFEALED